ncbi:hypothetical protein [Kitasatospora sp. NPDC088346]|uniref:hypothetical protein n=1 Tax=Kitasatospora sp. NPDC088346 TaxID=3364073 RepID=UPI0038265D6B
MDEVDGELRVGGIDVVGVDVTAGGAERPRASGDRQVDVAGAGSGDGELPLEGDLPLDEGQGARALEVELVKGAVRVSVQTSP